MAVYYNEIDKFDYWAGQRLAGLKFADQLSVVLSSLQETEEEDVTRVEPGATRPSTETTAK